MSLRHVLDRMESIALIAAPLTAPTLALNVAGALAVGTYTYRVTFVSAIGETDGGPVSAPIVTDAGHKRVDLSNIPVGPTGVTARNIYRTTVNGVAHRLLATLADNVTTTLPDLTTDAGLGVALPALNSTGFNGLMAAQITAAGFTGLDSTVNLYKRLRAEEFGPRADLPGLGFYIRRVLTNAKRGGNGGSGWRDLVTTAYYDYFATGPSANNDAAKLEQQGELAAATIWQLIDRLADDQSGGVISAGDRNFSIDTQISPASVDQVTVPAIRVLVSFPVTQEDRGL